MKSSLTTILRNAIVGKKIAEQHKIDERYWGKTIINVLPCSYDCGNKNGYYISTDCIYRSGFQIDADYELEVE